MALSIGQTTKQCCLTIVQAMADVAGDLSPEAIREDIAVLSALKSNANEGGLDPFEVQTSDGKTFTTEIQYRIPVCGTPDTSLKSLCTFNPADDADDLLTAHMTVARAVSDGGAIQGAQFRDLCERAPERLARRLMDSALDLIRAMADDLYALMSADCGNYPKSGDPSALATTKTLNLITDNGDINKSAFAVMKQQFKMMHTNASPIVIGGHKFNLAETINSMANQQGGVDYNPQAVIAGVNVYSDYKVDDEVEGASPAVDSYALAWLPGAFRLVEAFNNIGDWKITGHPDVTKTTVEMFGITFDYELSYDAKCDKYIWILQKRYDLFSIPDSVYSACFNFNHRLLFKIGCGAAACPVDL